MRIAIVGSGIAGLAAAQGLGGTHEVVMYEAAAQPGGHVHTVEADGHAIDMGFIVCNRERYPRFCALLDELGIATRPTTMSFSVSDGELEWGSESLAAVFADRRRLVDPRHWRFLVHALRFLARARRDLASELVEHASLDEYLEARRVSRELRDRFVVPLAARPRRGPRLPGASRRRDGPPPRGGGGGFRSGGGGGFSGSSVECFVA